MAARAISIIAPASRDFERFSVADTKPAIEAIQRPSSGRSASSDVPLITNAGVAMNSMVAMIGRGVQRRASA